MPARSEAATVYVIDDDDAVRDSLKLLLESHAIAVRDFASGPDFLAGVGLRPQGCVVLDLHLPVISGLDFLGRFAERLDGMPVILLTGKADSATRTRALEAGVSAFLEKPIEDDLLIEAVTRALAKDRAQRLAPAR
jgi:two-component system response regulator FixJ